MLIDYYYFWNVKIIFWYNDKYRVLLIWIIKVKYIVFKDIISKIVWIYKIINKIRLKAKNITLYTNNKIIKTLTKNVKS